MSKRPTHPIHRPATVMGDHPNSNAPKLSLRVVSSIEDWMQVVAIRSLVYIGDQDCPYDEEFDGNDFAGLHVLACVGNEPVGTMRLRFFADFVKLERVALRKEYRQSQAARKMIQFGMDVCRRKGYRTVFGHAQVRLLRFWRSFGFEERVGRPRFIFSDHEYAEIVAEFESHPEALTMDADPLQMVRPEGQWDRPGVLDMSSTREATNPNHA